MHEYLLMNLHFILTGLLPSLGKIEDAEELLTGNKSILVFFLKSCHKAGTETLLYSDNYI